MALGIFFGFQMNEKMDVPLVTTIDAGESYPLGRVEEVLRYIDHKYVNSINTDSLSEIAIKAIINELDPHSLYLPPNEMTEVNEEMSGRFKGIGIETLFLNDTVNIVRVIENTPAEKSGVKPFDQIVSINDSVVAGNKIPFQNIRSLLRGGIKDTNVKLTLNRENQLLTLLINLEKIKSNSVQIASMVNDSIGIVKIDQFTENTYQEFMTAVEELHDKHGMKHIIIDVRDNPGGVLSQVTKIVNQLFAEKDRTIVFTQGRKSKKNTYQTNGNTFFKIDKIAVLINENSASASEILAGAIQDWDRGVVIGQPSFGKGLVQEQYNLSNGGALRLTVSQYYTPSGRSIQKDFNSYSDQYTNPDTLTETSKFKSLVLDRDLYSNYGIDPDILAGPILGRFNTREPILSYIYQFVFEHMKLHSGSPVYINNEMILRFKDYAMDQNELISLEELNKIEDEVYMNRMRYAFNKISKGREFAFEENIDNDPCIQSAVNQFIKNTPLAKISKK